MATHKQLPSQTTCITQYEQLALQIGTTDLFNIDVLSHSVPLITRLVAKLNEHYNELLTKYALLQTQHQQLQQNHELLQLYNSHVLQQCELFQNKCQLLEKGYYESSKLEKLLRQSKQLMIPCIPSSLNINNVKEIQSSDLSIEIRNLFALTNKISESEQQQKETNMSDIQKMVSDLEEKYAKYKSGEYYWKVFVFGSEALNIRSKNSDIDIGIKLPFETCKSTKKYLLKGLTKILDSKKQYKYQAILHANYPIIRVEKMAENSNKCYQFDISIADQYCLKSKEIIKDLLDKYAKLNIPVRELIVFIKYWSKQCGINNAYKRYLNSFGYTIMVIKFLNYIIINKALIFTSLSFLVYEFFAFYCNCYQARKYSIQIANCLHNQIFDTRVDNESVMEIIDPVNNKNIVKNVGVDEYNHIIKEFNRAYDICNLFNSQDSKSLFHTLTESRS